MAEFWPENQSESSCAKIVKSSSSGQIPIAGAQSSGEDPPTVLSSSKHSLAVPNEASQIARELAGEMLLHFRLDDYVGVGGMGAVFRGTDMRLERPVALKILPPEQAKDPEIVQRFQQEARAAAHLDHENIARVFFVGDDRALQFIAFEFVEGVNVRELISQCGTLPPHEVVNYALQITGALVHAASRGVVHRDIKPSNIIITFAGRAKLVDMGLARNFERCHDGGLTQSNITMGTFDYIAPEQARDPRSADARSDIYSLGCTLFHMLTGRPPYPEGTLLQKLLKHQEESPPDARHHNPNVPAHLAGVVRRMMAKDPARRPQNPHDLLNEFLEIAADMGLRSTSPEGLIWVADKPRASLSRVTAAIWMTAAAVLLLAVWRLSKDSSGAPVHTVDAGIVQPTSSAANDATPDVGTKPLRANEGTRRPPNADSSDPDSNHPDDVRHSATAAADIATTEGPAVESEVIVVGPDQDFRAAIAQAPSGSIIELTGDHRPQMHKVDDTAGVRIEGKRLTIKAAPGSRPRLILSYDSQAFAVADWNLLTVVNSQLEFEGIHFEIQSNATSSSAMSIVACQSSNVTFRRCSFFQSATAALPDPARRDDEASLWVAQLDGAVGSDGRFVSSRLTASECFFGGGDGGIRLVGPARADLTDCVLLPFHSTFLVRATPQAPAVAADLRLNNVSLFGGGHPIFDLNYARASVTSQGVVYSHETPTQGVLVRVDSNSRMTWKGKKNIYHGLRKYLVERAGTGQVSLAGRLSDWLELSGEVEEKDSTESETSPWMSTLADAAGKTTNDPLIADAFRLAHVENYGSGRPVGSRFVLPWGPLYGAELPDPAAAQRVKQIVRGGNSAPDVRTDKPPKADAPTNSRPGSDPSIATGSKLDMKKIISTMPTGDAASGAQESGAPAKGSSTEPSVPAASARDTLLVDPQHPGAFATIGAACARAEDGAVIEVRHSGELREGPIELGDRHLTIRAAAGYRPTVNFAVSQFDLRGREPRLFDIRRGSLTLKDLDLHLAADAAISADPWAVVASRGADVQLEGCTVTVAAGASVISSVVRFLSSDVDDPMAAPTGEAPPPRPQFQMRNSFAVGSGQLVRVQPAVRVRIEIENCALDVQENLITVAGGMDRAIMGALNEVEIRHATVRLRSGLVSYEASESRSWLPRLEITTADNIFVSETDSPWIRFRSPRSADELRGLLRWKGMNNSYDGAASFWQIESMSGGNPETLTWDEWLRSPARDEIKADRGRIEFAAATGDVPPSQRTRFHFKPMPTGSASGMASDGGSRGADLNLVPAPPHEREPNARSG
jgi:serine/threonine protein kinase